MRLVMVLGACAVITGSEAAQAQPAAAPQPSSYAPAYGPAYAPAPYGPPPVAVELTLEEQLLLQRGIISDGKHIGGGLAAWFIGFGSGQAIQGRWYEDGWKFTLGEGAGMGVSIYGFVRLANCLYDPSPSDYRDNCERHLGWMLAGALVSGVFRVWGTIDAFLEPSEHNRRVRALHMRIGHQPFYTRLTPFVTPVQQGDGAVGGLTISF
jgi:hypothetical protein